MKKIVFWLVVLAVILFPVTALEAAHNGRGGSGSGHSVSGGRSFGHGGGGGQRIGHRPIVPTAAILILVTIFRFLPVSAFLAAIGSAVTITPTLITIFAVVSFRPVNTIWNRSKIPLLETPIKLKCPAAIGKPSLASPKLFLFLCQRPASIPGHSTRFGNSQGGFLISNIFPYSFFYFF